WPYLHNPVCRARTPGGPVHGVIEVAALQHERAADLFTRLVERSIADHAPAVTNLDGPGHRRRAEPRSVLQDSSLRGLLEIGDVVRLDPRPVELTIPGLVPVDQDSVLHPALPSSAYSISHDASHVGACQPSRSKSLRGPARNLRTGPAAATSA